MKISLTFKWLILLSLFFLIAFVTADNEKIVPYLSVVGLVVLITGLVQIVSSVSRAFWDSVSDSLDNIHPH